MVDQVKSNQQDTAKTSTKSKKSGGAGLIREPASVLVPVTAVGASAGGLDPIEQFFDTMPADSGCAFVVIQHLSPDFKSLMDELLARHSSMKIYKIEDGMEVLPNSIYLNTPRTVMTIEGNHLAVKQIASQENVYLPIDIFFKSLAGTRGAEAIGIVLSGTGSDGTKGSRYIHDAGGNVLVQDPATTRFDGMPRSVLTDGVSTLKASPDVLAHCVGRLLKKQSIEDFDTNHRQPESDPLADVLSMLKHSHGTDFLQYKEATVHRRIERRAQMRGITDIDDYRDILTVDKYELQELYADLLIEVTEFFRDQKAFEVLEKTVIPQLIDNQRDNKGLRVWVPGCASGEEAYSIAILLQEYARSRNTFLPLKIMATDIHIRSMNQATSGVYDEAALKNIPAELIERYFDCAEGQAQIKPLLRNMVFFSTHDVTRDPPFTRIDLISCRNLLIYLKEDAQEKVMNLLHFSLRKDGYLFLGPSEHIGGIAHEFDPVNEKWRIYKKLRDVKLLSGASIFKRNDISDPINKNIRQRGQGSRTEQSPSDDSIAFKRAHRTALESIIEEHAPPGFLLSSDGDIVHIFGDAGELIPMQAGTFSRRLVDLIKPELKVIVSTALDHGRNRDFSGFRRTAYIRNDGEAPVSYDVKLKQIEPAGEPLKFLLLTVEKLSLVLNEEQPGAEISQNEIDAFDSSEILRQRIGTLELSLQTSEESLQSTIEELETSNEELQSTNEELMSTNEELQSTNEELHSVNEELYTVSAEHQRKNDELTERDADISVLLQASKIGTIHLDEQLCLRRFSNNALSVFNILPQDIGRPIQHITIRAAGENIQQLVERVNTEHEMLETQLMLDESVFLLRIMPYRPQPSMPSGVLITVIDVTDLESANTELAALNVQYKDIVEKTDTSLVRWDAQTNLIKYCNYPFGKRWSKTSEELIGENIYEIYPDGKELEEFVSEIKPNELREFYREYVDAEGNQRTLNISIQAISNDGIAIQEYQGNGQDHTDEADYRDAMSELFSTFTNDDLAHDEKIDKMLGVGVSYFETDNAILGMVLGERCHVMNLHGEIRSGAKIGDIEDLDKTFSGTHILHDNAYFATEDIAASSFAQTPAHLNSQAESIIGATVYSGSGPYGTLVFSSFKKREKAFTSRHESFCVLMSNWIGFLVEQKEQEEFLSSQAEYYKSLFDTVPVMMFLCDRDGLILSASQRLYELVSAEPESLPGKNSLEVFDVDDKAGYKKAILNGTVNRMPFTLSTSNGTTIDIELDSRIKSVGSMQGVRMVVFIDVSDRNSALKNSEEQNHRLEIANESLNQFAFIASHDLQEPLRKIQQFSSFLEEDLQDQLTEDAKFHLDTIVDASARMSALIYDLLIYSGASKEEPNKELISLNEVLKDVQEGLQLPITESNALITVNELPDVKGDKALVGQLFTNLISNSIKYCASDKAPVIEVNCEVKGGINRVTVSDNGIGFEMKFAKKIFEPFNRLHGSKEYKGNGIGLAICGMVCQKHKWKISAQSEIGAGSTFVIEFAAD